MIEKIGTIKNPLTIIAIFAAIAEISGTVVLPFIGEGHQGTYIWFLIIFPIVLIVAFFLTLNFNHKVLYAPSDYKDESNFVKSLPIATFIEKTKKTEEELREIEQSDNGNGLQSAPADKENKDIYRSLVRRSNHAKYMLAEQLIFQKLQPEFTSEILRDVKAGGGDDRSGYIFDGMVTEKNRTIIIEVKFVRNGMIHRLEDTINRIQGSISALPSSVKNNVKLILAVAIDQKSMNMEKLHNQVAGLESRATIPVEVRLYKLEDLESEYGINP